MFASSLGITNSVRHAQIDRAKKLISGECNTFYEYGVYVYDIPDELDTLEHGGTIDSYDKKNGAYIVELYDGKKLSCSRNDFEIETEYDDMLPIWGTMWSFDDGIDDWWLEEEDGIEIMSECGFRIYESDEFGYFFGIDGAGYNFYEAHWIPLYKARGLQWHDSAEVID